jgi:serine/threonine protein kinase
MEELPGETVVGGLRERAAARIGQVLGGRWRLERLARVDLLGASYAASRSDGEQRGLRVLHPELARSAAIRLGFLDSAQLGLAVGHRDVAHLLEDGETKDGLAWYALDALEGELVSELVARRPARIPPAEALRIVCDTLEVLVVAHGHGVVHGALRPDKLLVTDNGTIKITDFGSASLDVAAATALGLGLPLHLAAFASPEQARHGWSRADKRSDVWAAGAILYHLLTGQPPRQGETGAEILLRAAEEPVRSLGELAPGAPQGFLRLLRKALELDEDLRFASARRMRTAVRELADDPEVAGLLRVSTLPLSPECRPTMAAIQTVASQAESERATRQFWGANAQGEPASARARREHGPSPKPTDTGLGVASAGTEPDRN